MASRDPSQRRGRASDPKGHGMAPSSWASASSMPIVELMLTAVPRQVQVMSTLPLKAMSRIWGKFNELDIPYYLRIPGFKLYSWIFGVKCVPSHGSFLPIC